MRFEPVFFVIAVILSIGVGVLLYRWQRPRLPVSYLLVAVCGTIVSVYYILNVVFGSGRTGWP